MDKLMKAMDTAMANSALYKIAGVFALQMGLQGKLLTGTVVDTSEEGVYRLHLQYEALNLEIRTGFFKSLIEAFADASRMSKEMGMKVPYKHQVDIGETAGTVTLEVL